MLVCAEPCRSRWRGRPQPVRGGSARRRPRRPAISEAGNAPEPVGWGGWHRFGQGNQRHGLTESCGMGNPVCVASLFGKLLLCLRTHGVWAVAPPEWERRLGALTSWRRSGRRAAGRRTTWKCCWGKRVLAGSTPSFQFLAWPHNDFHFSSGGLPKPPPTPRRKIPGGG